MLTSSNIGNTEILQVADAVAREKNIDKNLVLDAMENSVAIAARKKYGHDRTIKSEIDRKTGEIRLFRESEIVADDYEPELPEDIAEEDFDKEAAMEGKMRLSVAKEKDETLEVGSILREPLPPIDLGRVAAQTAKQIIMQKVRDAERARQYEDFKERAGEIINGTVKRVESGNIIVDLGNAEAIILRNASIRGETFRVNERIRAYVEKVSQERKGPQIFLSRTAPEFMAKLFTQEVPEIYDGIIEIKGVAREPGSRAKIAVSSNESSIDPVGSCVGVRGARVQAVINELQGEKIDIIQWSADPATFLVNALAPAEVAKVVIDEDNNRIEAVVPDDQLSLAIGRRGQNVRLASELVGWNIDIMTEDDESTRRTDEFNKLSEMFVNALNIDEIMAHLIVTEGFETVEEVAMVAVSEISAIEGFDDDIAEQLQARAHEYLEQKQADSKDTLKKLKVSKELQAIEGLGSEVLIKLGENGIKSLDDFADLSHDEFIEIIPDSELSDDTINSLIMTAREKAGWFAEDEKTKEA
ncbi:MAG: transcription termination/antitermination protein NusA [Alphaproteobacteria bacterium CG11_big_fil_rev_8_21_14_0_20_39_49]|nr:MAG: transcription termination/antitermination protein NusA [Alphaproteobacteria bacterium CG11_big_fil_rev_8_21_14_0_20_39_49]